MGNTYVVSDIHGCFDEYLKMLQIIKFDPSKDELIIAGDIVDRGSQDLEMLRYMESEPESVTFIKGNHDVNFAMYCDGLVKQSQMIDDANLQECLESKCCDDCFYDAYGTVAELVRNNNELSLKDFDCWKNIILNMPYYLKREIDDRQYIIVHAGFITPEAFAKYQRSVINPIRSVESFYLWAREEGPVYGGLEETTVVAGHNPTIIRDSMFYTGSGKVWLHEDKDTRRRFIDIDCGLVYRKSFYLKKTANLAVLKLGNPETAYYLY